MLKKHIDKKKIETPDLENMQEEINGYDSQADYDEFWDEWFQEDLDTTAAGCCNLVNNFFICI